MYKTVRKGDASLQYTILPQTDQFPSGGFPQTSGKTQLRIIKYAIGALMVLITMSCVATPFLMHQNDHNLFAGTTLAMSRVEPVRNTSKNVQSKETVANNKDRGRTPTTTTVLITEVTKRKDLEDTTTSFGGILRGEEEEAVVDDATLADIPETNTQRSPSTSETSTSVRQSATTSASPSPSATTTSASSSAFPMISRVSSGGMTESTTASSTPRKPKMPRVTLKLRENETIPQMYMKAGIASYKKGNITTSVLAHGLSLEGLIFKTPEGTIKPWPQKWFFSDPSADFQWKGPIQMPVLLYVLGTGMAVLSSAIILLMWYMQRKALRRQRPNIEEPEVEEHEEDKSTLLGAESQETEEKE
ncbi:PREDICTED: uncharacterized protein LOC106742972 [Dinoponera quadriceps]|uniref:Uncharacterized protein LOC106742972 n=1 Tax=Dinoponera quadriceps TaxID=609295 RepID=A0A6P3X0K0_DINQU|nr:PREDICTED: uncharacterized protein LOC106742972 [Dinoponera quadriceps]XP_014471864.1 PREDICTED: uncharacterized protein LOC106742972 [Dinoponera quadriceps]XP_014471865.1 PREDICTED: uncharacterized protein LOC106742972 [Dinoponera quadriceps]